MWPTHGKDKPQMCQDISVEGSWMLHTPHVLYNLHDNSTRGIHSSTNLGQEFRFVAWSMHVERTVSWRKLPVGICMQDEAWKEGQNIRMPTRQQDFCSLLMFVYEDSILPDRKRLPYFEWGTSILIIVRRFWEKRSNSWRRNSELLCEGVSEILTNSRL